MKIIEKQNNQKHLSLEQRNIIETSLNQNYTFKEIGNLISKDPTTISKEIRKHRIKKELSKFNNSGNLCSRKSSCKKRNICNMKCMKECRFCPSCNENCIDFNENICDKLRATPYVCNGCEKKQYCRSIKYVYSGLLSNKDYRIELVESREGINISKNELYELDQLISPLIQKGQSILHIYVNHKDQILFDKRTLYNYIDKNYLSAKNIDLPRKVRFKKRKFKDVRKIKDTTIRIGRTYQDFLKYVELNPDTPIVEMDTVEGIKGGKVLMTMLFRSCKLMLAFILDNKKAESVVVVFNYLEELLGEKFKIIFPIILTDNGTEFSDVLGLEINMLNQKRTNIFYCDPNASYQKGALEKNHEFIRYIIPKGISMNNLSQSDIDKMINNINSISRESLNENTPLHLASILMDNFVLEQLNLKKINPDDIILRPALLKK